MPGLFRFNILCLLNQPLVTDVLNIKEHKNSFRYIYVLQGQNKVSTYEFEHGKPIRNVGKHRFQITFPQSTEDIIFCLMEGGKVMSPLC